MYAILCQPGHNRVYFEQAKYFFVNELTIAASRISASIGDIKLTRIAGIDYLMFNCKKELSDADLMILSRLSFSFALFIFRGGVFEPVELTPFYFIDPNISRMLKYTGKTNEVFTRLLINVAVFSSDFDPAGGIRLLDPIAGKGTSLYDGLVCGYDVCGIEIGDKAVTETYHFLRKYLETEKYKHTVKQEKISGTNKSFTALRYHFDIARSKEAVKIKESREFEIISGDAQNADKFYKKNQFNIIVGDLPYGVQHGNVTNEKQSQFTRNPKLLLEGCLPVWKNVLAKGGVIALSWNTFVLSRKEMLGLFEKNGFEICTGDAYSFEHRVDQAIKRDIIAAKK